MGSALTKGLNIFEIITIKFCFNTLAVNKGEICSGMNGFSESCAPDEKNGIEKLGASAFALPPQEENYALYFRLFIHILKNL